ncbi:MAG: serine/threonine-protein kinase [Pirellulaceae bacterium]
MSYIASSPERLPLTAGALEAGVLIGDFRIERRIGAGGMGIVYEARQVSLDRPVALKVLGQALTRGTDVARFQREAQAAARLRHPAIAQVFYIGQDRHLCYLAMELIDGSSLRRVLDRLGTTASIESGLDSAVRDDLSGHASAEPVRFDQPTEAIAGEPSADPLPAELNPYLSPQALELRTSGGHVRRVSEVVRDAAQALAHAHEQGVIHRDIKPDNLLLDRRGRVHLIDFGIARFFDDQAVTYTGQLVGTPLYMSPEQVTGRGAIDARTDIYSLGLVLYEMLTLRPPIEATNRENLLRTIVTKPLPPVSWRNSAVSPDLERIVHKATQKDPDLRYASAADLAADLDRYLAGKPVTAAVYHFRLDEREITAARPGEVVLAAVIFFMLAFFLFMSIESIALMTGLMVFQQQGSIIMAVELVVAFLILIGGILLGRGLLFGRSWSRWSGVAAATLLIVASIMAGVGMGMAMVAVLTSDAASAWLEPPPPPTADPAATPPPADESMEPEFTPKTFLLAILAVYSVPILMGLLLGGVVLWSLLTRRTAEWFRFARDIRSEHRRMREELAG